MTAPSRPEPRGEPSSSDEARLIAYRIKEAPMRLVPAPSNRRWMDETRHKFANRCLPLKVANQAGWFVLHNHPLRVTWDGGDERSSMTVEYLDRADQHEPEEASLAYSHFGHGILTFEIPYLFRTPPGYNLLVRGPANWPKDGAYPLEGLVETDWSVATFTMNWKLTRPGHPVEFGSGEPVCMVVPQRRGELEGFAPEVRDLNDDLVTAYDYWRWLESRWRFMTDSVRVSAEGRDAGWQKHYVRGTSPTGTGAPEHQTKLRLRPFEERRQGA